MTEEELLKVLQGLFDVPGVLDNEDDLRQYIQDSIDVGELAAVLRHDYHIAVELKDFKDVYTFGDLLKLVKRKT